MSKTLSIGQLAPDLSLEATGDQQINLSTLKGHKIVVYFYPKDSTPGCTTEGQNFRDCFGEFKSSKCLIFGVSRDTVKSHENFKAKQTFPFELLSDTEENFCQLFDVIKEKNMYGRKYMGIERSTFLFNAEGLLVNEWRKVRVKNHVEEVLFAVQELDNK